MRFHLDWERLFRALKHLEVAYPPLCGRFLCNENGGRVIAVNPEEANGFGVVETEIDATLAGLRRCKAMVSGYEKSNAFVNWPFFLERPTDDPLANDDGSLFGVHLTHARDGCVLSFSFKHLLCDGARIANLMVDVSRAYRGLEIAEKHLDRSLMWPDQYLSLLSVEGHSAEMYPRCFTKHESIYPESTVELRLAHIQIPQTAIARMKAMTKDMLHGTEYVSTNDLLVALCWMLRAEFKAKVHPVSPTALSSRGTRTRLAMDASRTRVPLVPENYFGNVVGSIAVEYPPEEPAGETLTDIHARAASLVRHAVYKAQTDTEATLTAVVRPYIAFCTSKPSPYAKGVPIFATQAKMPFNKIDFGHPGPLYLYMPLSTPCAELMGGVEENPNGDGLMLYVAVNEAESKILESSRVLAECAPGAELFPEEMSEDDANRIMRIASV